MPTTYTYPGVYVQEIPSGVRTIVGVSTSNTAFIGSFARGPVNKPTRINNFSDFVREFGGVDNNSDTSYAVSQYYANGGQVGYIVRVEGSDILAASLKLKSGTDDVLTVTASSKGEWGNNIQVGITLNEAKDRFTIVAREVREHNGSKRIVSAETYRDLVTKAGEANSAETVINGQSALVTVTRTSDKLPDATDVPKNDAKPAINVLDTINDAKSAAYKNLENGNYGKPPSKDALKGGVETLDKIEPDTFSLMCMPEAAALGNTEAVETMNHAINYCESKFAFFIADISSGTKTKSEMKDKWMSEVGNNLNKRNASVYFPRVAVADAEISGQTRTIGASGTMAGLYARTDSARGVWKAPAGTDAGLRSANVSVVLNDLENGELNELGVNVLRNMPIYGNISWGARTLDGSDASGSEWKYIPVRRTALFIEATLFRSLKWVVFEPNDEPLWSQIRLSVGSFLHTLFRQGAFQGATPREAYFVKCDSETTTQTDINNGIVNIVVGFAPLKPAEFVVIQLQQMTGQTGL